MSNNTNNGWTEWSRHVLAELKRLDCNLNCLERDIQESKLEIAVLKVKAGIWGILGGLIPILISIGIYLIQRLFTK